ncbi:FAD-dependent monooxygenase [Streptomyces catenulae]|uniref:FAD-dependent monooxygenase n=1 Tax=Streptomyces catenulae TaxID=66875 RepID=A0ABV2Z838_9ACTN|nr:FAD-dependent monooxygenase [Streptomyces catenulae]
MTSVLISGASVAGLAAAHWLRRAGCTVTVVERALGLRPGGQALDVRGVALEVLERGGQLAEARALRTTMRGMSMLDGTGAEQWRSTEATWSAGPLDSPDIEVFRDELTVLLHRYAQDGVEYLFDDSATALAQDADGVRVDFLSGRRQTFDLVVGADGLHSTVRRLAFGPEERYTRHLGAYVGVFRSANFLDLADWQIWLQEGDASLCVYPTRDNGELRTFLGFRSDPLDLDRHDTAAQRKLLGEKLGHLGGPAPQLLAAMQEAPDFFFDAMAQIHMDRWSAGRVVLIGDAAHCPSPLSGQGSSLALAGAYVLADELGRSGGDHRAAFTGYERRMRPYVTLNQALALEHSEGPPPNEVIDRAKNALRLDV